MYICIYVYSDTNELVSYRRRPNKFASVYRSTDKMIHYFIIGRLMNENTGRDSSRNITVEWERTFRVCFDDFNIWSQWRSKDLDIFFVLFCTFIPMMTIGVTVFLCHISFSMPWLSRCVSYDVDVKTPSMRFRNEWTLSVPGMVDDTSSSCLYRITDIIIWWYIIVGIYGHLFCGVLTY